MIRHPLSMFSPSWLSAALAAVTSFESLGLTFPQTNLTYNAAQNRITFSDAWAAGDRVGYLQGWPGTPIGPTNFITALHLRHATKIDYKGGEYTVSVSEAIQIGSEDVALCKISSGVFSDYAKLSRNPAQQNQSYQIYGLSNPSRQAITVGGNVRGWAITGPGNSWPYIHKGLIKNTSPNNGITWNFSSTEPSSCSLDVGDSGGPIFLNNELLGIAYQGSAKQGVNDPVLGCANGFIFNSSGLTYCVGSGPVAITTSQGKSLFPFRDAILDKASPPRRFSATSSAGGWVQVPFNDGGSWNPGTQTTTSLIATNGLTDPAPQAVYQTTKFYSEDPNHGMYWSAGNLIQFESYRVRIHLSSVSIPSLPSQQVVLKVGVYDKNASYVKTNIRPYSGGLNKATIVEFTNTVFVPNSQNIIWGSVKVDTANGGAYAVVSGVEVIRIPTN